jgi:hypothetical protein
MPVRRGVVRPCGAFTSRSRGARNNTGGFFAAFLPAISKERRETAERRMCMHVLVYTMW